jgi:septal ring factor EnvC (AmiA/AmiB activator)
MHHQPNKRPGNIPPATAAQAPDIQGMKDDIVKIANFAEQVAQAVVRLDKKVTETQVNTSDVRPQLLSLKVHTESIPVSLRETRRLTVEMQQRIEDFDTRLQALETRINEALARADVHCGCGHSQGR